MVRSICAQCFSKVPLVYFILYIIFHFPHFLKKIQAGERQLQDLLVSHRQR